MLISTIEWRATAIDYEKVLTASESAGADPTQAAPSPVAKPRAAIAAKAYEAISAGDVEEAAVEGDSDEEGEQSGEELSAEDDDEDASESEDDLLERAPVRLEADLTAEVCQRPHTLILYRA